eukprot:scaffold69701_cov17-Tisochrysis_lutea.AAC.2
MVVEEKYIWGMRGCARSAPAALHPPAAAEKAAVMEGSSGEGEGRQDSFAEGERMEGVPAQPYVTNLFCGATGFRGLANDQIVLFEGKMKQKPLLN